MYVEGLTHFINLILCVSLWSPLHFDHFTLGEVTPKILECSKSYLNI
jgi:hypothetical protein